MRNWVVIEKNERIWQGHIENHPAKGEKGNIDLSLDSN